MRALPDLLIGDALLGFVPVCGPDGRLVGVLTGRDIAVRVCAFDGLPSSVAVGDAMTEGAVAARPERTRATPSRSSSAVWSPAKWRSSPADALAG
jgi:CBS domain-containing protein